MNKIRKIQLKDELKYMGTTILKYSIQCPEIIYTNNPKSKNIFNIYNKKIAKNLENYITTTLYEEAKKTYVYNKKNNFPVMVYEVILQYNITYNRDYIISLYYDQYEFTGGAHRNYYSKFPKLGFTKWQTVSIIIFL